MKYLILVALLSGCCKEEKTFQLKFSMDEKVTVKSGFYATCPEGNIAGIRGGVIGGHIYYDVDVWCPNSGAWNKVVVEQAEMEKRYYGK